jgi:hypothetical protein
LAQEEEADAGLSSESPVREQRGHEGKQDSALRRLIRGKLQNGRLPHEGVQRIWSSPSDGQTCDACDTVLAKDQMLMEGVTLDLGRSHMLQLHVRCFQMWEHERRAA